MEHTPNMVVNHDEPTQVERDRLYATRAMHLEPLERFLGQIEEENTFREFSTRELQMVTERIRSHFNAFERAHMAYRTITLLASNEIYLNIEQRFMSALVKIDQRLPELGSTERAEFQPPGMQANSTMFNALGNTVCALQHSNPSDLPRTPRITKFSGNPADWPAFKDLFIAEVHNKAYDDVSKLLFLQGACIGNAARTLGPWPPVAANYQPAWETLMHTYDDLYQIVHGILSRAYSIQNFETENYEALSAVVEGARNANRQLTAIVTNDQQREQMWIFTFLKKLPRATCEEWEAHRTKHRDIQLPSFAEFLQFLETKARGKRQFEYGNFGEDSEQNSISKHKSIPFPSQERARFTANNGPYQEKNKAYGPRRCIMPGCKQTHYLGQCGAFKDLPIIERLEQAKAHRLCHCCLLPGHYATQCKREGCRKCPEAKFKHHYAICTKLVKQGRETSAEPKPENISQ